MDSPEGFTDFAQVIGPEAFRLALYWVKNRTEAEDIIQEAFTKAWKHRNSVRTNTRAWFLQILWRVYLDKYNNASTNKHEVLLNSELEIEDRTGAFEQINNREVIRDALTKLSDAQRQILHMRYGEDLPIKDISVVLQIPVGTIKANIHRALRKLRSHLLENGDGIEVLR
jgi:RNA polymerase sigma factor (sigma-70 family)